MGLPAGEQQGNARLVEQCGVIESRPQSIKAPGQIVERIDHHRRPRCDQFLPDDPGFLPATDDRVQVMLLAESQCLKYVAGTIGSEDKDPVLSSVFKRCSACLINQGMFIVG